VPDLIRDVAVVVREDRPGNRKIVAYCIPVNEEILNDMQRIHGVCSQVRLFLESEMPSYMVPSAFILVAEFPITPNGKLNTKQLPRVSDILSMDPSRVYPPSTDTEKEVAKIWMDLLNLKTVSVHSEFQDLGGDSLNAAKLLIMIEDIFSVKCPTYEFFGLPTISNLSRIIDVLKSKGDNPAGAEAAYIDLTKEIQLDPAIQPESPYVFAEPKNILLTGATGFLGAYLLRDLMRDDKIEKVFALVRAKDDEHALERIR
jgi:acyl carrier protein